MRSASEATDAPDELQRRQRKHPVNANLLEASPEAIARMLREAGIRRVIVELNGREYRRAIMGRKDGERYVVVSKEMMREMGAAFGDTVLVDLWPDPDPDRVDFCEELVGVLDQDEEAAERFYGMTPGRQRSFSLHVWRQAHRNTHQTRT